MVLLRSGLMTVELRMGLGHYSGPSSVRMQPGATSTSASDKREIVEAGEGFCRQFGSQLSCRGLSVANAFHVGGTQGIGDGVTMAGRSCCC